MNKTVIIGGGAWGCALGSAVLEKKTILVANEARLLKKSFLGFAILAMAFQTNNFGDMVRSTLVDAYLQAVSYTHLTLPTNVAV